MGKDNEEHSVKNTVNNIIRLATVAGLGLVISVASFAAPDLTEAMNERLKPVGEVCMAGDNCAAAPVAEVASSGPRSGEDVYTTKCSACHGTGAAGAPKYGSADDWGPRASQGLDTLYTHALNGFKGMPAKGLCMDCSEDEVKSAVEYMVNGSK